MLWLARIGLIVFFVAHVYFTYKLAMENRAARPQRYAHPKRIVASVPVMTMLLSGLLLLTFIIFHLAHFTWKVVKSEYATYYDAAGRPDVYHMVVTGFSEWPISIFTSFRWRCCVCTFLTDFRASFRPSAFVTDWWPRFSTKAATRSAFCFLRATA